MSIKRLVDIALHTRFSIFDVQTATEQLQETTGEQVTTPDTVLAFAVAAQYIGSPSLTSFVRQVTGAEHM